MVWDSKSSHAWRNPMQMKSNKAWVFTLAPSLYPIFQKELIGNFVASHGFELPCMNIQFLFSKV
jgi:hypothetical protein